MDAAHSRASAAFGVWSVDGWCGEATRCAARRQRSGANSASQMSTSLNRVVGLSSCCLIGRAVRPAHNRRVGVGDIHG